MKVVLFCGGLGLRLRGVAGVVRDLIDDDVFLANYGDTVTHVPLPALIEVHRASGKTASLLAVPPTTRSTS